MAFFGSKKTGNGKLDNAITVLGEKPAVSPPAAPSSGFIPTSFIPPVSPPAAAPQASAPAGPPPASLDPAIQKQLAEARTKIQAAVGQIVLAMSNLPRYRNQMLGDVQAMVLDPLMRDRIAIASEKADDAADAAQTLAGIAFWATVSEEVDARIREQIKTGSFPVRLKSADWNSGNIVWLLDVIAPSQKLATNVLLNFRKVLKDQSDVRIHPVVARQIDPELLKKLTAGIPSAGPSNGSV